jgi:anti-anti-sigma factor
MKVTFSKENELEKSVVAHLEGTVDVIGAQEIWTSISSEVGESPARVLIDFSDVSILTSAGIGTMVRIFTRLKAQGGSLAVFGCDPKVREIFRIVMLEEILQVCDSREEALERLKR